MEEILSADVRAPLSTYRLQMHAGFTFDDARATLDYMARLGIGDLYLSPIFEARPGSTHGYDVTRHDRLNAELGGEKAFERLSVSLRERNMGLLLDIVPNHMGVGNDSRWWFDVLENGRASQYAEYFDIDWAPLKADMQGKLLLPILGAAIWEKNWRASYYPARTGRRMHPGSLLRPHLPDFAENSATPVSWRRRSRHQAA